MDGAKAAMNLGSSAHALVLTLTLIRCRERGVVRTRTRTGQNGWRVDRPRTDLKAERGVLVDTLVLMLRIPVHSVARYRWNASMTGGHKLCAARAKSAHAQRALLSGPSVGPDVSGNVACIDS